MGQRVDGDIERNRRRTLTQVAKGAELMLTKWTCGSIGCDEFDKVGISSWPSAPFDWFPFPTRPVYYFPMTGVFIHLIIRSSYPPIPHRSKYSSGKANVWLKWEAIRRNKNLTGFKDTDTQSPILTTIGKLFRRTKFSSFFFLNTTSRPLQEISFAILCHLKVFDVLSPGSTDSLVSLIFFPKWYII